VPVAVPAVAEVAEVDEQVAAVDERVAAVADEQVAAVAPQQMNEQEGERGEARPEQTSKERTDEEITMIMDNIIADKSKERYLCENIKMLMFLFESRRGALIKAECVRDLDNAVGGTEKETIKRQRAIAKKWISETKKELDNCPIHLDRLTFTDISRYMSSRKRKDAAYLAKSSYDGIRSAMAHLYHCAGKSMNDRT